LSVDATYFAAHRPALEAAFKATHGTAFQTTFGPTIEAAN